MIQITIYNPTNKPIASTKRFIIKFLHTHLEEYGDRPEDITKCFDYAMKKSRGGFIVTASIDGEMVGASIINSTGMQGFIPENILVYIATHASHRGKGIASALMDTIIEHTNGNIALHVEHDNPAINLYMKYGFTNKYLEMRLDKTMLTVKKEETHGAHHA